MAENEHIGEILESGTGDFTAQCVELHASPPFGGFVKAQSADATIYAIVYEVSTGSIESHRRPMAYGKTEDELREEQPQIFDLLCTSFRAFVVGYRSGKAIYPILPPHPPKVHTFVHECTEEEVREITLRLDFIERLKDAPGVQIEELIAAALRQGYAASGGDRSFLVRSGRKIARFLPDNYASVSAIMRRAQEWQPEVEI